MTRRRTEADLDQIAQRTEADLARLAEQLDRGESPPVSVRRGPGRPPLGASPSEPLRLRLDPELRRAVTEAARAQGTSDSELVRAALRYYLASQQG